MLGQAELLLAVVLAEKIPVRQTADAVHLLVAGVGIQLSALLCTWVAEELEGQMDSQEHMGHEALEFQRTGC